MNNPAKFFKRNPLRGFAAAETKEMQKTDAKSSVVRRAIGPYLANAFVALSMFQTYTYTRLTLHGLAGARIAIGDEDPVEWAFHCDAIAGLTAGVVQGTLSTPLYNMRLGLQNVPKADRPTGIIEGLIALRHRGGYTGLFQNYRFVLLQECCSLVGFFTSYGYLKQHCTNLTRKHVDPSGGKDICAWAVAASGAGVVLVGIGKPFENILTWHINRTNTKGGTPVGALHNLLRYKTPAVRRRIVTSGLTSGLLKAPLVGLPLLVYETAMHWHVESVMRPIADSAAHD